MDRRTFIGSVAFGLLVVPLVFTRPASGEGLSRGHAGDDTHGNECRQPRPFRQGLRDLGYVEGSNLIIEYRSTDGHIERFVDLAAELVGMKVDVIVARQSAAAMAPRMPLEQSRWS